MEAEIGLSKSREQKTCARCGLSLVKDTKIDIWEHKDCSFIFLKKENGISHASGTQMRIHF